MNWGTTFYAHCSRNMRIRWNNIFLKACPLWKFSLMMCGSISWRILLTLSSTCSNLSYPFVSLGLHFVYFSRIVIPVMAWMVFISEILSILLVVADSKRSHDAEFEQWLIHAEHLRQCLLAFASLFTYRTIFDFEGLSSLNKPLTCWRINFNLCESV